MTTIMLRDGSLFDPFDPESLLPSVHVFCHSLSMLNRYTGHTNRPYSVAEHVVHLATSPEVREAGLVRAALLHDFGEAVTNDIPRPFKQALPEYCAFEDQIQRRIFTHFDEPWENMTALHTLDFRICVNEMNQLFKNPPDFGVPPLDVNINGAEYSWTYWRDRLRFLCYQHGIDDK